MAPYCSTRSRSATASPRRNSSTISGSRASRSAVEPPSGSPENAGRAAIASSVTAVSSSAKVWNYLVREPVQLPVQRLELQHEQLDARRLERLDAFHDLAVAADQTRECAAVGPDPAGARQHFVHLGVGVGARRDLRPALGV